MKPVTFSTLADYRREGMAIWAHCTAPNSGHAGVLDLDRLIARLGPDHQVAGSTQIGAAVVCSACGHKGARITISPGHATAVVGARRENGGAN